MALIDLHFAEPKDRDKFRCSVCRNKRPKDRIVRRCDKDGYDNRKLDDKGQPAGKGWRIDQNSPYLPYCPGKSQWDADTVTLFEHCKFSSAVGVWPKEGTFWEQQEAFIDVYPAFRERWEERKYARVWRDVTDFTPKVVKVLGDIFLAPWKK